MLRTYGAKFRSGNLLENGNKNRWNLPCGELLLSLICRLFLSKLHVHIKDNNNSPHGKFHRFLFPFSSKFPDLNFAPYVLYIYSCHETRTWHKQWAWDTRPRASPAYIKGNENECCAGSQICESKSCIRLTGHRYSLTSEIMQCCQHGDFCFSLVLSLRIVSGWTVFICLFYI